MTARRPAEVFPPGDFLREELDERGWTQAEFAEILGRPARLVNEIIAGKRGITPETAKGLAAALGTSPEYWLNLESSYQLWRVRGDDDDAVVRRARIYGIAPVKDMIRRGWIEASDSIDVLEKRVADFFETDTLEEEPAFVPHAARKSTTYESTTQAQNAWLFRARKLARAVHAAPFRKDAATVELGNLRQLLHASPEIRRVPRILGDAGIRFVVVEALPGTRIDGACFWLEDSPVVALSLRHDRIDNFWFTLLHEIAHVMHGERAIDTDLEGARAATDRPESERVADDYASEHLVPRSRLESFIARVRPLYSARRIEAFAQTIEVHPGIVIGQLQNRGEVSWASFRKMLVPIRDLITQTALTDGWDNRLPAQL